MLERFVHLLLFVRWMIMTRRTQLREEPERNDQQMETHPPVERGGGPV